MVSKHAKKIANWKCPESVGVQGYWLKHVTMLHRRLANQMNDMIINGYQIPRWMIMVNAMLCQKYANRSVAVENYSPISCLPFMWKLVKGIIQPLCIATFNQVISFLKRKRAQERK